MFLEPLQWSEQVTFRSSCRPGCSSPSRLCGGPVFSSSAQTLPSTLGLHPAIISIITDKYDFHLRGLLRWTKGTPSDDVRWDCNAYPFSSSFTMSLIPDGPLSLLLFITPFPLQEYVSTMWETGDSNALSDNPSPFFPSFVHLPLRSGRRSPKPSFTGGFFFSYSFCVWRAG